MDSSKLKTRDLLSFLQDGLDLGLNMSTLRQQVAALRNTLDQDFGALCHLIQMYPLSLREYDLKLILLRTTDFHLGTCIWYLRGYCMHLLNLCTRCLFQI